MKIILFLIVAVVVYFVTLIFISVVAISSDISVASQQVQEAYSQLK